MSFGTTLKFLRKKKGLTQTEFAKNFQISSGTIAMWETNKRQPDQETLIKLAEFFNVTIDYLLTTDDNQLPTNTYQIERKKLGLTQTELAKLLSIDSTTVSKWELGKTIPTQKMLTRLASLYNVSTDYLLGRENDLIIPDEVEFNDIYKIPLLGRVVAGVPLESEENLEGYVFINFRPKEDYFALRVKGESMINAGIRDKSILIVHKQSTAECGDIVVAMLNGESTVKRFKVFGEDIFLMPENPTFEPIRIQRSDDFLILGKVVEVRISI